MRFLRRRHHCARGRLRACCGDYPPLCRYRATSGNASGSSIFRHVGLRRAGPMCEFRRALNNINAIGWLLRAPSARTALLRYRVNHPLMCRYFAGSVMCTFHCTCIARAFYAGEGYCGGACGLTLASEYGWPWAFVCSGVQRCA